MKSVRSSGDRTIRKARPVFLYCLESSATIVRCLSVMRPCGTMNSLAVDITGIKQAVRMTPDTFLRLVAVPFGRRTADRTAQRSRLVYAHMYMDCRLFLVKFCAYDIPWILQTQ